MATASVDTVTRTVTENVDEEVIQLTLNKIEGRALYALGSLLYSGDGAGTYAREIKAIQRALTTTSKFPYIYTDDYFYVDDDNDVRAKAHKFDDK